MAFDTFTGTEYLKIDIANHMGLDKALWNERIAWVDSHEDHLESLLNTADEPALYFAAVQAYRDVQANKPIGYTISLDATSSGLQLLAVLTGDTLAASLCNVIDTGNREDAYTGVYTEMVRRIGGKAKISRDQTKDAIMTSLYGSTAMPKLVFGDGPLLDIFYSTMEDMAPGAWELNKMFLALWNPDAYSNDWVLPDNFHVQVKVMGKTKEVVHFLDKPYDIYTKVNEPQETGRSLGANTIHSIDGMVVREMTRRCGFNPVKVKQIKDLLFSGYYPVTPKETLDEDDLMVQKLTSHAQQSGFLSARILDHLNESNIYLCNTTDVETLIESLPANPFTVLSVHDCFRCLPHYGNDLRRQYNTILMEIARSELLSFIISQLVGRLVPVSKLDPDLWKKVADTNYALS